MNDDFRFQILDDDAPCPSLVPDDDICTWAWLVSARIRIGVVWACQNNATGFLPNPAANGVGNDFDVQWNISTRRLFASSHAQGDTANVQAVLLQLAHRSDMFSMGAQRVSVRELRDLLDLNLLTL